MSDYTTVWGCSHASIVGLVFQTHVFYCLFNPSWITHPVVIFYCMLLHSINHSQSLRPVIWFSVQYSWRQKQRENAETCNFRICGLFIIWRKNILYIVWSSHSEKITLSNIVHSKAERTPLLYKLWLLQPLEGVHALFKGQPMGKRGKKSMQTSLKWYIIIIIIIMQH